MSKMSKRDMITIMKENGWHPTSSEKDFYDDVKNEFDLYLDETSSDSDMFPNGRDWDAENEDGPF